MRNIEEEKCWCANLERWVTVVSRLPVFASTKADEEIEVITSSIINRMSVFGNSTCPLEAAAGFFKACAAQSCGKCTPCRVGLSRLTDGLEAILRGEQVEDVVNQIEMVCDTLYETADCAIGFQAGKVGIAFAELIRADASSHIEKGICMQPFTAVPCVKACPSHVDIPGYIALVREGRFADAVRLIRNDNPFPSACAFVCEHPCEETCRRGMIDAPVNIRALKQHAVLNAGEVPAPEKAAETGKKIAVIGGGPSGLTCAYYLALMGHSVTVFEQNDRLGGMLLYGIPRYRLPQKSLDYDIDAILSLGIDVKYNTKVGRDISLEEIDDAFDAIYIAIGAHTFNPLGIDYQTRDNVYAAVEFLHNASSGNAQSLEGKDVVVIGGGNVAMDATRTAKRLGAKSVHCIYRRRKEDMTALSAEVESAIAEGCEIVELMAPVRVEKGSDKPLVFVGQPQMPGSYKWGRPSPVATSAPEAQYPCDIIIEAIGQVIDSDYFAHKGLKTNRGKIIANSYASVEDFDKVFSGGDSATGPSTVIRAISAGKVAAANIDAFLGYKHDVYDEVEIPVARFDSKLACGRINIQEREAAQRGTDFDGVEVPLLELEAQQECGRCLRCDHYGMGSLRGGRPKRW